jgi:integrase/recombinase XerD
MNVFDPSWQVVETMRLTQTKGNKFREVPLVHEKTRVALKNYIEWRRKEHWLGSQEGPLFRTQRGGHFSPDSMQQHFHKMYLRAGLLASSHSGRRSFATRLILRGADIFSVMTLMGHSNINTTQLYFSTSPEHLRNVARLLG